MLDFGRYRSARCGGAGAELAVEIAVREGLLGAGGAEEFKCNARDSVDYEGNWATFPTKWGFERSSPRRVDIWPQTTPTQEGYEVSRAPDCSSYHSPVRRAGPWKTLRLFF